MFVVSLKGIFEIKPNANNLPFQANWGKCKNKDVNRTWNEARKYLLSVWADSAQKAIDKYSHMKMIYPEFFNED